MTVFTYSTDMCINGTASASVNSKSAYSAFDNNTSNTNRSAFWLGAQDDHAIGAWIAYTFPVPTPIGKITFRTGYYYSRLDGSYTYGASRNGIAFEGSNDGVTWNRMASWTDFPASNYGGIVTITKEGFNPKGKKYRIWRFIVTENNAGRKYAWSCFEAEMMAILNPKKKSSYIIEG